jgi:peptidyl-tRNA hydrolase, PTH1 family
VDSIETANSKIRLVAGLGNPGPEYQHTRHNIGFLFADLLASRAGMTWEKSSKWGAQWTKLGDVLLVKPMTYMNRSGEPIAAVARFHKIVPGEILVVLDDFSLPLGRLRIRQGGSPGGHNGLESVVVQLGTDQVPRLRIGIGDSPREGSVDYVLGKFFEEERPVVVSAVKRAADAVKCAIDNGLVSAMNTFNKGEEL